MPIFENAKTVHSEEAWKSRDGKMTIHKVTLDVGGQNVEAKTYSDAIAKIGWSGTVESYEKDGKFGAETFVKQPQKEGGPGGSHSGGRGRQETDPFTMYLSYAKDIVVAHITTQTKAGVALNIEDSAKLALELGRRLYNGRPGAESSVVVNLDPQGPTPAKPDTIFDVPDDDGEEINLSDIPF